MTSRFAKEQHFLTIIAIVITVKIYDWNCSLREFKIIYLWSGSGFISLSVESFKLSSHPPFMPSNMINSSGTPFVYEHHIFVWNLIKCTSHNVTAAGMVTIRLGYVMTRLLKSCICLRTLKKLHPCAFMWNFYIYLLTHSGLLICADRWSNLKHCPFDISHRKLLKLTCFHSYNFLRRLGCWIKWAHAAKRKCHLWRQQQRHFLLRTIYTEH